MTQKIRQRNAVETYEWYRQMAFAHDAPESAKIPYTVLRNYLDIMTRPKTQNGLHNVTVTVSQSANLALLDTNRLTDTDITIRVEGQKW